MYETTCLMQNTQKHRTVDINGKTLPQPATRIGSSCRLVKKLFSVTTSTTLLLGARMAATAATTVSSICFALLLSAATLTAAPIVLDFEDFPTAPASPGAEIPLANQLSTQYLTNYGVTFSSAAPYVGVVTLGVGYTTSGSNGLSGAMPDGTVTYDDVMFIAEFFDTNNTANPAVTDFFSVRGDTVPDGSGGTLRAYDVNGQQIGEQTIENVGGDTFSFSVSGIHRVTFTGSGTIGLDDVTFDPVTSTNASTNASASFPATIYPAVEIAWTSVAGQNYQVQSTPSLTSATWTNFGTVIQGDGTQLSVFDKTRNGNKRFYQILKVP